MQEMTVELKSWQQQESTYQRLIHEHTDMSKKASESIPEAKDKIKRLQIKIEDITKNINEVNQIPSPDISIIYMLINPIHSATKRRRSIGNGQKI